VLEAPCARFPPSRARAVDYASIPQEHRKSQEQTIRSLSSYASISNALVIVAPMGSHFNTDQPVGVASYNQRMCVPASRARAHTRAARARAPRMHARRVPGAACSAFLAASPWHARAP
jgi:hypothetical protein